MQPHTFVFFGIVGSGKGTQIKLLLEYLKAIDPTREAVYVYPGAEYRKIIESKNYTGRLVEDKYNKGHLQPDFLTNAVFTTELMVQLDEDKHLIVDAFPRTTFQAETLEAAMQFYNRNSIQIVYLELSKEEATKRMKLRGRSDDTDAGIARRFDEYVNNVVPAMNYFKGKVGYTIHEINGEQTIEKVHEDIKKALGL